MWPFAELHFSKQLRHGHIGYKSVITVTPFQMMSTRAVMCMYQDSNKKLAAVGAKSGRLESLSGGSKQSQSTSSKLRLTADSSNQNASSLHQQHVDSDADSHPRPADSQPGRVDSIKPSLSVERQRTSDLSSKDILDTAEDKVRDESQSQDVANVRCAISIVFRSHAMQLYCGISGTSCCRQAAWMHMDAACVLPCNQSRAGLFLQMLNPMIPLAHRHACSNGPYTLAHAALNCGKHCWTIKLLSSLASDFVTCCIHMRPCCL